MALIKCKEYGKEISDKVEVCPNCGVVFKKNTMTLKIIGISIINTKFNFFSFLISPFNNHFI